MSLTAAVAFLVTACGRPAPTAPSIQATAQSSPDAIVNSSGVAHPDAAAALTLVDVTAGSTGTSNNYAGQSVTIPGHAAYHDIRFNWYTFSQEPTAFGTLYVLAEEYVGPPTGLSESTPGFVARSASIEDGAYVFDHKVKIKGGTTYWFYTDATGAFATGFYADTYPGGDMYVTGMPGLPFHLATGAPGIIVDANFRLQVRVAN